MKNIYFQTFLFFFFSLSVVTAQECNKWGLGANFDMLLPTELLKDNGHGTSYGANFDIFYLGYLNDGYGVDFMPGFRIKGGATPVTYARDVILEIPVDAPGVAEVYNSYADFKFVPRVVLNSRQKAKVYFEGHLGVRFSSVFERISLVDSDPRFGDETNRIDSEISRVTGASAGILIPVSSRVDIDVRYSREWTKEMRHLNIGASSFSTPIGSNDARNVSLAVGVFVRLGCNNRDDQQSGKKDIYKRRTIPVKEKKVPKIDK